VRAIDESQTTKRPGAGIECRSADVDTAVEVNSVTTSTRRPAAVGYDRVAAVYDWYTAPMEPWVAGGPAAGCSAGPAAGSWSSASVPGST
jgi:hypothetical protein